MNYCNNWSILRKQKDLQRYLIYFLFFIVFLKARKIVKRNIDDCIYSFLKNA